MSTRLMDPVDTIWLNMDRADNLMVIEGVMTTDEPLDLDRLLAVLQERVIERFPVFSQRPASSRLPLGPSYWEDDPDFDLARHVRTAVLPPPGNDLALQRYVSSFFATPLPRDRPLWEMHVLEGYDGGSAVYSRLHHSLADGIALMQVLLSLTDEDPEGTHAGIPEPVHHEQHALIQATAHLVGTFANPVRAGAAALDVASLAMRTTGVAAKLLMGQNPDSPFEGTPGTTKRAIWGEPTPLEEVKGVARRTGTTVNDVVVAALAGALATYQLQHGAESVDIPTMVPVNLRPPDEPLPDELGNCFALVLLSLPSGLATPFERLVETHRRMRAIKHSPEAWLTFGMIRGIGLTGPHLERLLVDFFANKATGVTTNVPGPRTPRYLAGSTVTAVMGWAPESGRQTLGTCICTYAGRVHVGFKVDTATIAHPEDLVAAFDAELAALCALAPG